MKPEEKLTNKELGLLLETVNTLHKIAVKEEQEFIDEIKAKLDKSDHLHILMGADKELMMEETGVSSETYDFLIQRGKELLEKDPNVFQDVSNKVYETKKAEVEEHKAMLESIHFKLSTMLLELHSS